MVPVTRENRRPNADEEEAPKEEREIFRKNTRERKSGRNGRKESLKPPSLLKHASGNSGGKRMMGRLPHPTRKVIITLCHISKEKGNVPSQRLDLKRTRSNRNICRRSLLYIHQATGS
ncbi:hypothetical protein PIB30_089434 [Stylosanthes scabra]|uniref:Uncharacterized protein n=1 Tax=Stylosanthes scabra TaxID=79078 RepID=A0ABU6XVT5_9FABA|nr:hypothetical protein [Stylosanthes scabra]